MYDILYCDMIFVVIKYQIVKFLYVKTTFFVLSAEDKT